MTLPDAQAIAQAVSDLDSSIGIIEATQTMLVPADSNFYTEVPYISPIMAKAVNLQFDHTQDTWSVEYDVMSFEGSSPQDLNNYNQVLYVTKQAGYTTENPCVVDPIPTSEECVSSLKDNYHLPFFTNQYEVGTDDLVFEADLAIGTSCSPDTPSTCLHSSVQNTGDTFKKRLTITIPHQIITDTLSKRSLVTNAATGAEDNSYEFGIGIVFLNQNGGPHITIFDKYLLTQNGYQQLAIEKTTSYAEASFVSFLVATRPLRDGETIPTKIAILGYSLKAGHELLEFHVSINDVVVNAGDNTYCQAVDECMHPKYSQLCTTHTYDTTATDGSGETHQNIDYVVRLPCPDAACADNWKINTVLKTRYTLDGVEQEVFSTLNLADNRQPVVFCEAVDEYAFDPTEYVDAEVFMGYNLHAQTADANGVTVAGSVDTNVESLMLLHLKVKDQPTATDYFNNNPLQKINLDDLYMAHSVDAGVRPWETATVVVASSTSLSSRATLSLQPALTDACPVEVSEQQSTTCVTTHDWGSDGTSHGPLNRPKTVDFYYVHEVVSTTGSPNAADLAWLSSIFQAPIDADNYLQSALAKISSAHDKLYFIWPVYGWPASPVGLIDHTRIMFVWSVTTAPASSAENTPQTATYRRLLSVPENDESQRSIKARLLSVPENDELDLGTKVRLLSVPENDASEHSTKVKLPTFENLFKSNNALARKQNGFRRRTSDIIQYNKLNTSKWYNVDMRVGARRRRWVTREFRH